MEAGRTARGHKNSIWNLELEIDPNCGRKLWRERATAETCANTKASGSREGFQSQMPLRTNLVTWPTMQAQPSPRTYFACSSAAALAICD